MERSDDELIGRVRGRAVGRVQFRRDVPRRRFVNQPSGYVSPEMVRLTLATASEFGRPLCDGWDYVVNSTGLLIPDIRNVRFLAEIPKLPNLNRYIIVAPNPIVRAMANGLRLVSHPDQVCRSMGEIADSSS